MQACGGLMTAVNRSTAGFMPMLEMVMVPPWYSSGLSLPSRARLPRSLIWEEMDWRPSPLTFLTIGVMRPTGVETATETSTTLCWRMMTLPFSSRHDELAAGTLRAATARALTSKSLTESLYLPSAEALRASRSLRSLETEMLEATK